MTEAEEILLVAGGQSTIPLVSTLPADGNPPVVMLSDNSIWVWNGTDYESITTLLNEFNEPLFNEFDEQLYLTR